MCDRGWIKIYRKMQDCWIWSDEEPFDKRSAWIDLLLAANHSDKKMCFNGELIVVGKGQIVTSIRRLADKWKWSTTKIRKFLDLLESDGMLSQNKHTKNTLITIENYGNYQVLENTKNTEKTQIKNAENTERTQREHTIQECKNERIIYNNNIYNNNISPFIPLTEETPLETPKTETKKTKSNNETILNDLIKEHGIEIDDELLIAVKEWLGYKKERRFSYKEQGLKSLLKTIETNSKTYGSQAVIEIITSSIANGYQGILWDRLQKQNKPKEANNVVSVKTNKFNNYDSQRKYDFNDLEKRLLGGR